MDLWSWIWIGLGFWAALIGLGLVIRLFVYKEAVPVVESKKAPEKLPKIETNKRSGGAVRHAVDGSEVDDELENIALDSGDDAYAAVMDELSRQTGPQRISKIKIKKVPAAEVQKEKKPSPTPPPSSSSRQSVVTEKTRESIQNLITGVKSISREEAEQLSEDLSEQDLEQLRESQIIHKLASTLVSEVKVEEAKEGKYSKVSLDASLFFDEEDVNFFEKEFEWDPEDEDSITDKSKPEETPKNET